MIDAEFVGSFPAADFKLSPSLPEVAFIGRSNVGKSSLLNAIVGRKALARTSKQPGKTRDCNIYRVEQAVYIVDLPGYGYARVSQAERRRFARLIDSVLSQRPRLAGVVWLLDVRRDPSQEDLLLGERLAAHRIPTLVAITKGDKLSRRKRLERAQAIGMTLSLPRDQIVVTSAVTREGIDTLRDTIRSLAEAAA